MNQHVKRFFAAMFCVALCLPLIGMTAGLAQAQAQTRDMMENLSEFQVGSDLEIALWLSVANSGNPAEIEYYLERYPDGEYVGIANRKLDYFDYKFRQSSVTYRDMPNMQNYLESYPGGRYAVLTMERIARLESERNFQTAGAFIIAFAFTLLLCTGLYRTQRTRKQRRDIRNHRPGIRPAGMGQREV